MFDSITPNYTGEGEFNMFGLEVVLFTFMYERILLGTGKKDCVTDDSSQIGHNMRMRLKYEVFEADHYSKLVAALMMYRARTT